MTPTPYLIFQGTCREAMEIYADVFGGEVGMMMRADAAEGFEVAPAKSGWIMHGEVRFAGGLLMGSDDVMGDTPAMAGCSVMMSLPTVEDGARAFARLAEDGHVEMEYQPTFWSPGFGTLRDRYGINWMITTDAPLT